MEQDKVVSIGKCSGCQTMAQLQDHACKQCALKFGPKFGPTAKRMREDPSYRKMCFDALKTDVGRKKMLEMFGDEGYAIGSPSMAGKGGR
jgi:predicted amidophosphoribosyltransferase